MQEPKRYKSLSYMPQLDGVRGLAVLGPMVWHFMPRGNVLGEGGLAPWGPLGVDIFFVLSGFLISSILLRCRDLGRIEGQNVGFTVRQFYIRRFIRIFPLFYVALFLAATLDIGRVREFFLWHFFYLSNVGMTYHDQGFGHATHLWSLSVEEQFYLVWPLVLLCAPKRWLRRLVILSIVFAIAFRFGISLTSVSWHARKILPFACFDAFGLGTLLALSRAENPHADPAVDRKRNRACFWIGTGAMLTAYHLAWHPLGSAANVVFGRFFSSLLAYGLIAGASGGLTGLAGRVLAFGPLAYLGRISYGVYVLHHFMMDLIPKPLEAIGMTGVYWPWLFRFVIWSFLSIALASISWHLFEKPINDLKKHYPYRRKPPIPEGGTGVEPVTA